MGRRRRLIERNDAARSGYPAAAKTFTTGGDAINAVAYSTPPQGVESAGSPPNAGDGRTFGTGDVARALNEVYDAGGYDAYDPASGAAFDATNANGAYNATTNANGPIDEAGGEFSLYNDVTENAYSAYTGGDEAEGDDAD